MGAFASLSLSIASEVKMWFTKKATAKNTYNREPHDNLGIC
jgi:hypothetical protein